MNKIALRAGTASLVAAAVVGLGAGTAAAAPGVALEPAPAPVGVAPVPTEPVVMQLLGASPLETLATCLLATGSYKAVCPV